MRSRAHYDDHPCVQWPHRPRRTIYRTLAPVASPMVMESTTAAQIKLVTLCPSVARPRCRDALAMPPRIMAHQCNV